jgi:hypothetical protein
MNQKKPHEILRQQSLMIEELEKNYGSIKNAAKAAGIHPSTHYRWMKEDDDYERKATMSRDVGCRNLKENIIEIALRKAEKGNAAVINQLIRTFLKYMPDEMKDLNRANNVRLTPRIKYIDTREEAMESLKKRGMPNE